MADHSLRQIQEISALLNSSLDPTTIRTHAIEAATLLMNAEAGSLLLLDGATGELYFEVAHGEKGAAVRASRLKPGQGIAGYVARTGQPLIVNDVQRDQRFFGQVDQASGFVTRNMVCVPVTAHGRLLGVLQAINRNAGQSFDEDDLQNFVALGHQVGIAIENANLYEDIHLLFEGFISASVQAIESRDPTTSGHSQRVATLTCRLAEEVSLTRSGLYAGIQFTADQMKEIRYAAVLHDFGKVGIRENLLLKAKKLYPAQQELIKARFDFIKRTMEVDTLRRKLRVYESTAGEKKQALLAGLDEQLARRMSEVDELLSSILTCNQPASHSHSQTGKLKEIARMEYRSYDGPRPFLTDEELGALSVLHGSLTRQERNEIERHVTHTFEFLSKIPWSRALQQVPAIAWSHHEKLDGSGYPRGLSSDQIPLQARMMTICDIYDALTASDRPYKAAIPSATALGYLESQAKEGKLDSELVDLFAGHHVYQATQSHQTIRKVG
ncbi:MAG: HD domain-containing phosphohydrolase [Nitrospirota bacterium]|nr:HD domain-containing phosphohydrolase [Nitrospirota bacterium]MDP2382320.1 HD domain-containing phosphohydrolase [Nitrospirota bacterium]